MSMLRDAIHGKSVEIDAMLTVTHDIGLLVGVPTPFIDSILGLARLRANSLDCCIARGVWREYNGDYGKGIVTQPLLDWLKTFHAKGVWLSMYPKPPRVSDLSGVSLLTPNRKEAFELAGIPDTSLCKEPSKDQELTKVAEKLLAAISPKVLLITLGEHGDVTM